MLKSGFLEKIGLWEQLILQWKRCKILHTKRQNLDHGGGWGGGGDAVAGIGKKCGKCGKTRDRKCGFVRMVYAPMFRLILHDRALKAWTV